MRTIAVLQSNYLPWKGYFDIIHDVDEFIFYDEVQYTKNDWRNRNRIYAPSGLRWLTLPCGYDLSRSIDQVQLKNELGWAADHLNKLREAYRKAPFFRQYIGFFESVYLERTWIHLSELNQFLIRAIAKDFLGIDTVFSDSRAYGAQGDRKERLLNLLTAAGAERYVSGPSARSYIAEQDFAARGIRVTWKDYAGYPAYPQGRTPFEHNVSIVDLLFNVGEAAGAYIWGWRA
jgi:hypothetical protein